MLVFLVPTGWSMLHTLSERPLVAVASLATLALAGLLWWAVAD